MATRSIELKKFGPEFAGERVGWVSAVEAASNSDIVDVNIVTATVSPSGASYGLDALEYSNGRESSERRTTVGLYAATSLHTYISKSKGVHPNTAITFRSNNEAKFLVATGASYGDMVPVDSEREWANGPTELWGITREKLADFDLSQHLPHVYYDLNHMSAHQDFRTLHKIDYGYLQDLLVPDASMHQETMNQLLTVQEMGSRIQTIIDIDKVMQRNLTVFSNVPVSEIPDTFELTRRTVAACEQRIIEAMGKLAAPLAAYKPVGFRPNGRTWPYMDPLARSEEEAFGIELGQLRKGQTQHATRELSREISEAELRLEFARNGAYALSLLSAAEHR